eukprot:303733_1
MSCPQLHDLQLTLTQDGHVDGGTTVGELGVPVGGDRLGLGVEVHTLLAVEVDVTTDGATAAGEAEEGQRHGDGHVDADLTAVHLVLELAGRSTGGSEDGGAVTVGVGVDHGDGIIQVLRPGNAQGRGEDLLLVAVHVGLHVVNDGGAEPVALGVALDGLVGAVQDQGGTLGLGTLDDGTGTLLGGLGDHGTEVLVVLAGAALQLLGTLLELGDPVGGLSDEDGLAQGHAALAAGTHGGANEAVQGVLLISIGHDDTVVLGTHVGLDTLAVGGTTG